MITPPLLARDGIRPVLSDPDRTLSRPNDAPASSAKTRRSPRQRPDKLIIEVQAPQWSSRESEDVFTLDINAADGSASWTAWRRWREFLKLAETLPVLGINYRLPITSRRDMTTRIAVLQECIDVIEPSTMEVAAVATFLGAGSYVRGASQRGALRAIGLGTKKRAVAAQAAAWEAAQASNPLPAPDALRLPGVGGSEHKDGRTPSSRPSPIAEETQPPFSRPHRGVADAASPTEALHPSTSPPRRDAAAKLADAPVPMGGFESTGPSTTGGVAADASPCGSPGDGDGGDGGERGGNEGGVEGGDEGGGGEGGGNDAVGAERGGRAETGSALTELYGAGTAGARWSSPVSPPYRPFVLPPSPAEIPSGIMTAAPNGAVGDAYGGAAAAPDLGELNGRLHSAAYAEQRHGLDPDVSPNGVRLASGSDYFTVRIDRYIYIYIHTHTHTHTHTYIYI